MPTAFLAIRVDDEFVADAWWTALQERFPKFAAALRDNDGVVIASDLWGQLAALPGFSDGPEYATTALIDCGGEGEQWAEVVAGTHAAFEQLS